MTREQDKQALICLKSFGTISMIYVEKFKPDFLSILQKISSINKNSVMFREIERTQTFFTFFHEKFVICDFLPLIFALILKNTKNSNILLILSQDEINFVQYYDEFCALKLLLFLTQIFRQRKRQQN